MATYRKKPVEIEAEFVDDALHNAARAWNDLPRWLIDAYENGVVLFAHDAVVINTLEGTMRGERGDWIIRGVKGELYPCKPDIFAATYDEVPPIKAVPR